MLMKAVEPIQASGFCIRGRKALLGILILQANGGNMLAVIADRAGAVAFNFGRAIIRPPDDANVLPVWVFLAAFNGGIELDKKSAFACNSEVGHHAFFKIAASTLIKSVATFVAYI